MELEEKEFNKRILLCILIVIIMIIFFILFVKINYSSPNIIKSIDKKESMIIYIISDDCKTCDQITSTLNSEKVSYNMINKDKNNNYKEIIKKLNITDEDLPIPAIIYVKDGEKHSTLVDITDNNDLEYFIIYYKLSDTRR